MPISFPLETFPALDSYPDLVHGFVLRHPDIDVTTDRDTALLRLKDYHRETLQDHLNIAEPDLTWYGEQVHSDRIAVCAKSAANPQEHTWPQTDGLITAAAGEYLGIYVADCCAVFLVDPVRRACGLVHSGKKGTELKIAPQAISLMEKKFGCLPANMIVQLSPCIRPPAYEIDFAATIRKDCADIGVPLAQIHDPGTCTSQDLDTYYSYRTELGQTGRHLAVVGWKKQDPNPTR